MEITEMIPNITITSQREIKEICHPLPLETPAEEALCISRDVKQSPFPPENGLCLRGFVTFSKPYPCYS